MVLCHCCRCLLLTLSEKGIIVPVWTKALHNCEVIQILPHGKLQNRKEAKSKCPK